MQQKYNKSSMLKSEAKLNEKVLEMLESVNEQLKDIKKDVYDQKIMMGHKGGRSPSAPRNISSVT